MRPPWPRSRVSRVRIDPFRPILEELRHELRAKEIGFFGELAARIVYAPGYRLPTGRIWSEWQRMHGMTDGVLEVGGYNRPTLVRRLTDTSDFLPAVKSLRIPGEDRKTPAWIDARLVEDPTPAVLGRPPTPQADLPVGVQALDGDWLRDMLMLAPDRPALVCGPGDPPAQIGLLPDGAPLPAGWRQVWPDGDTLRTVPATGQRFLFGKLIDEERLKQSAAHVHPPRADEGVKDDGPLF